MPTTSPSSPTNPTSPPPATSSYALATDQADVPAIAVRRDLETVGREIEPEQVDPLETAHRAVRRAMDAARPYEAAVAAARRDVIDARSRLAGLQRQHDQAGPIGRRRLREPISQARLSLERAQDRHDLAVEHAQPYRDALTVATTHRDALAASREAEQLLRRLDDLQHRAPSRPGTELGIGL